jgi:hypothetical protein
MPCVDSNVAEPRGCGVSAEMFCVVSDVMFCGTIAGIYVVDKVLTVCDPPQYVGELLH